MNARQFAGTKKHVHQERHYNTETSQKSRVDFNAGEMESIENNYEIYVTEEGLKKLHQPFNVLKTISCDGFQKWDTDFLIESIVKTHHEFAKDNAVIIYSLAQKVAYRHCESHPELLKLTEVIFLFFHDLLNEMRQEEFFFAYIRQIAKEKRHRQRPDNTDSKVLTDTLKLLQNDLEKALNYLKVIRQIAGNYKIPSDACHSYRSLLEMLKDFEEYLIVHFHLEKDILFLKLSAFDHKNTEQIKY